MMPTCSVQMPIEKSRHSSVRRFAAFTLTELVVVILILSLMIALAGSNLYGLFAKNTFRGQLQEIVSLMQMAANSAAETGKRYELVFNLDNQNYMLRQITTQDLFADVLDEEIIATGDLAENCRIADVTFDDGVYTRQGWAKFRVGRSGWQAGGRIVFLDGSERPYSLIVNRLNRNITLLDGYADILMPRPPEEMAF